MKNWMKTLLAALLAFALLMSCALAEEEDYGQANPESLVFDSNWVCDGVKLEAVCEDGGFRVRIEKYNTLTERIVWQYSPLYNAETGALEEQGFGSKEIETLDLDGYVLESSTVYEDGAAVFTLDEQGRLIWQDEKENAGADMAFVKIGRFDGMYVCGRAQIQITWDSENIYSVQIQWGDSASAIYEWLFTAEYDAENDCLNATGMESRVEYNENGEVVSATDVNEEGCSAVFQFDENGMLRWTGTEGAETEDMLFERDEFAGF